MNRIRVLIVEMPRLITDIVEAIVARQPDIELVGVVGTTGELHRAVRHSRAHVILCHLDDGELPVAYRELFDAHPRVRLLAIEAGDRTGSVYELRPARTPLDVWPQGLMDAIRSAGSASRAFAWDALGEDH